MKIKTFITMIGIAALLTLNSACMAEYDSIAIKAYNNGIDLTNQEKYKEAIVSFEKAIKIEPAFADAYYNLGIIHQYLGNYDKALDAFEKNLEQNPEDYEVIYKIAVLYHNMGKNETALDYIKKIPPDDPNFGLMAKLIKNIDEEQTKTTCEKAEEEKEELTNKDGLEEVQEINKFSRYGGFEGPAGIAADSKGNLYVANYSNNSIICIDKNGERVVLAKDGAINGPLGLAVDKKDNLYVANFESNQIVIMPAEDRAPLVMPFIVKKPYFLMVDDAGMLYVTEQGNNSVSQHKLDLE